MVDDVQLLKGIRDGRQDFLSLLYDRYGGVAYGLAWKMCGNRALAEDVVQEAFMAIWQRPGSFDPGRGSAGSFLLGIVHHKAVDPYAARSRFEREESFASDLTDSSGDEVVEEAWLALRPRSVRDALRQLSDVQREALELAYL